MLISVVIPIYNSEQYLEECLDSLLNQTFDDFEVILVNDGSTDHSGKICDVFAQKDSRIKVIHKQNGGVSSARNAGIKKAEGKYVTFVDADDQVKPTFLQDFNAQKIEGDFFVQGYINWNSEAEYQVVKIIDKDASYTELSGIIEKLEVDNFVLEVPWGKLFRKEIIAQYNLVFNENLSNSEDHLFVIEYMQYINSIIVCSAANYCYRKFNNESSLSQRFIPHDKLYLYAKLIYRARLNNILKHRLGQRYNRFTVNVHSDLLHKSLHKLFSRQTHLEKRNKELLVEKYLQDIKELSENNQLKIVKTGVLIRIIWNSKLPFRLNLLETILDR